MKVQGKNTSLSVKKVKSKARTIEAGKVITFKKKAAGKVTYKKKSVSKNAGKFTVAGNGKITVAKGTPAGKYTVKVNVTAAGDNNYKKGTATATFKITIK